MEQQQQQSLEDQRGELIASLPMLLAGESPEALDKAAEALGRLPAGVCAGQSRTGGELCCGLHSSQQRTQQEQQQQQTRAWNGRLLQHSSGFSSTPHSPSGRCLRFLASAHHHSLEVLPTGRQERAAICWHRVLPTTITPINALQVHQ